jgi:hypothetical protein
MHTLYHCTLYCTKYSTKYCNKAACTQYYRTIRLSSGLQILVPVPNRHRFVVFNPFCQEIILSCLVAVAAGLSKVAAAILFSAPPAPAPVFRWRTLESAVPLQGPPASAAAAMLEAAAVVTEDDCGTGKKPVIFFCPRPFSSPPFFLLSDSLPMVVVVYWKYRHAAIFWSEEILLKNSK